MTTYILRRLAFLFLTVILTSLMVFLVTQWLPGDVCRIILGREAGQAAIENCQLELGLDQPLPVQYFRWLGNFLSGDWGISFSTDQPIYPIVMDRLQNSLLLALVVLVISVPVALTLGIIAGLNEDKPVDSAINVGSLSVVGLPEFVTGLVLIQIFSFGFRNLGLPYLPASSSIPPGAGFWESLPMLILPAITATLVLLAYIARLTRNGVIEELKQPYVRTADLKGLPRQKVITRHVLRNALLPAITIIAISTGWLISGLVVIENVFNYPGLGRLMIFAIDRRDLPLLQAVTMVTVLGFALANLAADFLYALLNPRIRFGE
ncbi:MAG: ABC transporter permease [Chloroflexota bacterium]|nr:MAG: ABC transporter permease [Chloroflexota bacterium]